MEHLTKVALTEIATQFLASLPPEEKQQGQQEVNKFVRWCGRERLMNDITVHEVAEYAESLGTSSDPLKRLESVRAFLLYAKKEGFTRANLSINLKVKRSSAKAQDPLKRPSQEKSVPLTAEGRARLLQELDSLKQQRMSIVEELRKAAADKDFRENAPLEAARQYQGQTEARIRELEEALRSGTIQPDAGPAGEKVGVGKVVALLDLISGERLQYTLVSPREANPMEGRISVESPVGKALLAKRSGEEVEVSAPAGTLRYRIEEVKG